MRVSGFEIFFTPEPPYSDLLLCIIGNFYVIFTDVRNP